MRDRFNKYLSAKNEYGKRYHAMLFLEEVRKYLVEIDKEDFNNGRS